MFSNDSEFISVHVRGKCLTRFFTVSLHLQFVNSAVFLFTYYHSTPCNLENSPVKKITINILRERRGKQCKITVDPLKIIFLIAQFKSNK